MTPLMLSAVLASFFAASAAHAGVVRAPVKAGPVTPAWGTFLGSVVSAPSFGASPLKQFNPTVAQSRAGFSPVVSKLEAKGLSVETLQGLGPVEREAKVREAADQAAQELRGMAQELLAQNQAQPQTAAELWLLSNVLSPYLEETQRAAVVDAHAKAKEQLTTQQSQKLDELIGRMALALGSGVALPLDQDGVVGKTSVHKSGLLPASKNAGRSEKAPASVETGAPVKTEDTRQSLADKIASLWSRSWGAFYRRFDKNIRASLAENHDVYSQALADGDSYTTALQGGYGFKFGASPKETEAPTPEEFFAAYNARIDRQIADGVVKEDEVARPGVVFWNYLGKPYVKQPGKNVSWLLRPDRHFLGDFRWFKLLGSGVIAFGNPLEHANGGHTLTEHDIAHILALEQHPRYTAEVVTGLRRLTANPALLGSDGQFHHHLNRRVFFVTEYLSVIKPGAAKSVRAALNLPKAQEGRSYPTVDEAKAHLEALDDAALEALAAKLREIYPKSVEHVGGASKDLITMAKSRHGYLDTSLPSFYRQIVPGARFTRGLERKNLLISLARLQVALLAFSDISPEQFARESLTETVDPKSKTYEIMVELGLFNGGFDDAYSLP